MLKTIIKFFFTVLVLFILSGCAVVDENAAIIGTWSIVGDYLYYSGSPPATITNSLNQIHVFNADGTFTLVGTAQWTGSTAQEIDASGTFVYDAAAGTIDHTYTFIEMDGVALSSLPVIPTCACAISGSVMTITFPAESANEPYTPAEPLILNKQ